MSYFGKSDQTVKLLKNIALFCWPAQKAIQFGYAVKTSIIQSKNEIFLCVLRNLKSLSMEEKKKSEKFKWNNQ